MDDKTIIQHYWDRDETALTETDEKYGRFCSSIADNILKNREDTKECLNDTYLKTWNTIPTQRPEIFPAFLGKIVRNLAVDRYRLKLYLRNWMNVCRTGRLKSNANFEQTEKYL